MILLFVELHIQVINKLLNFVIYLYEIENNVIMCVLE